MQQLVVLPLASLVAMVTACATASRGDDSPTGRGDPYSISRAEIERLIEQHGVADVREAVERLRPGWQRQSPRWVAADTPNRMVYYVNGSPGSLTLLEFVARIEYTKPNETFLKWGRTVSAGIVKVTPVKRDRN